jgi:hypothetical protein
LYQSFQQQVYKIKGKRNITLLKIQSTRLFDKLMTALVLYTLNLLSFVRTLSEIAEIVRHKGGG